MQQYRQLHSKASAFQAVQFSALPVSGSGGQVEVQNSSCDWPPAEHARSCASQHRVTSAGSLLDGGSRITS
eukprot:198435-Pelagomonas_calceolata.AAC.2